MNDDHIIKTAGIEDLESIISIYNTAVNSKFETADTLALDWKKRIDWFKAHDPATYPIFVYKIGAVVAGWISVSPYRQGRMALRFTVEISYYVHEHFRGRGIAEKLLEYTIIECRKLNYRTIFAIILDKNEKSINLLTKHGFEKWGHMPNVADFNGTECGHVYYGLRLY
ncbi:MAG: N-acetyltransferase family protein [Ferruginibacter sp.]